MDKRDILRDSSPDEPPVSLRAYAETFDEQVRAGAIAVFDPLPSGFPDLDAMLGGGFFPERLYTIGGAPGIGKTSWALQATANITRSAKAAALTVLYEHSGVETL